VFQVSQLTDNLLTFNLNADQLKRFKNALYMNYTFNFMYETQTAISYSVILLGDSASLYTNDFPIASSVALSVNSLTITAG